MHLVVLGLALSSSWGNGHATTYRALLKAFAARGHQVTFLERDMPWYAAHRDLVDPAWCRLVLYDDLADLGRHRATIADADAVVVGSYVPDGIMVGRMVQGTACGVTAFYDIDTPVTLAALAQGTCDYLVPALIPGYDVYLSFTGGPTLDLIANRYGAPRVHALYCTVDPELYAPEVRAPRWDLSYLGTYSPDRQPAVERLLVEPARSLPERRFVVAGPGYPDDIAWPANVERVEHVGPAEHAAFYGASRYTLNVTRANMVAAGWSPSVRLFEAAACAAPILSDSWAGLDTVFAPGREILTVEDGASVAVLLRLQPESVRQAVGAAARRRVLAEHAADRRAETLEAALREADGRPLTRLAGSIAQ